MSELETSGSPQPQESNQPSQNDAEKVAPAREKVGDVLHKERVTRRITVETIAKDLKLNAKYIKAIEANNFRELPADPYVRVYLRSIAAYLMLDPDDILKRFFEDRGVPEADLETNRTGKLKINVERDSLQKSNSWIVITAVVAVFIILIFISNRQGWISTQAPATTPVVTDTTVKSEAELLDSLQPPTDPVADSIVQDSSTIRDTVPGAETHDTVESIKLAMAVTDTLKLVIRSTYDSVWVQVFSDGVSWKNFIKSGEPRLFTAKDSFNVHVGNNNRLKYILNGKKVSVPGSGVKIFKVDHNGIETCTLKKWKEIFSTRL